MEWEHRFVFWDEDRAIEISVARELATTGAWYWCARDECADTNLKMKHGYGTASGAQRAAERWYRRHISEDAKARA